jgi:hypothetical protein
MQHDSFVYKWTSRSTGKFYIEFTGSEDDGYVSSGRYFLSEYRNNPGDFEREILYRGTSSDCLQEDSRLIEQAIDTCGRDAIYNITTWNRLKQWTRRCLVCGATCYPQLESLALEFEEDHFLNCSKRKVLPQVVSEQPVEKKVRSSGKISVEARRAQRNQWWRERIKRLGKRDAMNPRIP